MTEEAEPRIELRLGWQPPDIEWSAFVDELVLRLSKRALLRLIRNLQNRAADFDAFAEGQDE